MSFTMSIRFPFDLSSFSTSIYSMSSVKQYRRYLDTSITHLDEEEDISRRRLVIKRRRAREREKEIKIEVSTEEEKNLSAMFK